MNKLILWFFLIAATNVYSIVEASLPEHPICGVHTADRTSPSTEFPWTAHLVYSKPGNKKGIHCRGTLISDRFVLTSGHCVGKVPSTFTLTHVKLGGIKSTNNVAVAETILNDDYDAESKAQLNDIALLKLDKAVEFSDKVQPICLPVNAADRNVDLVAKIMEVSEYGRTTTANRVEVHGVSNDDCKAFYTRHNMQIVDSQVCAGSEEPRDGCAGNGGGALMSYGSSAGSSTPHYMLVGVSSFGPRNCGTKADPDVYTRVSEFMDWIVSKVN